jgi:hypothetical protein
MPSVQDLIDQNALAESAEYAIKNFGEAMQFVNKRDFWEFCIKQIENHKSRGGGGQDNR